MKLSDEDRVNIVKQILDGQSSAWRLSKELGISESYIKRMVYRAKQHGLASLLHAKRNKTFSPQEKYDMVRYAIQLGSTEQAAAYFNINESNLTKWKQVLDKDGFDGLVAMKQGRPRKNTAKAPSNVKNIESANKDLQLENEKLKKELEQAHMENDFLKKLDALVRERIRRESSNSYKSSKN